MNRRVLLQQDRFLLCSCSRVVSCCAQQLVRRVGSLFGDLYLHLETVESPEVKLDL